MVNRCRKCGATNVPMRGVTERVNDHNGIREKRLVECRDGCGTSKVRREG